MKKLIGILTSLGLFLFASPAFAYTVSEGDTMSGIAKKEGMTLKELATANPQITDLDFIYVGQTIHLKISEDQRADGNHTKERVVYTNDTEPIKSVKASQGPSPNGKKVNYARGKTKAEATTIGRNSMKLTKAEIDLLARVVRAEAQSETFKGKVAVAEVILNRVESPSFPNSIKGVIYAPGQFQPVSNGQINKPADEESHKAVQAALANKGDSVNGAVFFYNPAIATNRWLDTRQTTAVIGNHVFKK